MYFNACKQIIESTDEASMIFSVKLSVFLCETLCYKNIVK